MKQIQPKESHYYKTFKEFLIDTAERHTEKTAITTYRRGGQIIEKSFSDLKADSFAFAKALFFNKLNGKNIALVGENSYEWLVAYFGITISGGVAICIDIDHTDKTIASMISQADAEAAVCSDSLHSICEDISRAGNIKLKKTITINPRNPDTLSFADFIGSSQSPEATELFDSFEVDPAQTASIVYTSGTTSTAKPVMLSHRAILYNAADSLTILDSREKIFNSLPLYHTYGLTCGVLCGLIRGINVCLCCDIKRMIQDMTLFKPNLLVAVPLIVESIHKMIWASIDKSGKKVAIQKLIKLESVLHKPGSLILPAIKPALEGTCLEELNVILSGGAHLETKIGEDLLHFGMVVLQGYGITECSPSITCNRNEDFSLDSVGMLLPGCQVKIVDEEIYVKSYSLMNGYYNAPELTEESFDDGWFKTGDLGYLDKKGHLHITGRKKNLIVMKNGKKVAAEEMENELKKMPLIKEVMVYGAISGASMDDVKIAASVYPDPELTDNMSSYEILQELQIFVDNLNPTLPIYKQIEMINIRDTDFERTASHKIKRQIY